jgi:nicotinamide-nucleotide amidase
LSTTETFSPVIPNELEDELMRLLSKASEREIMLATAESCTGGMVASLLTDVPGVSHAFDRGFVTYTNEAKHEMLGVPLEMIEAHTAVSREVAVAMAEGGLGPLPANILFAVTGYADSGAEPAWFTSPAPAPAAAPFTGRSISGRSGAGRCGCNACASASR